MLLNIHEFSLIMKVTKEKVYIIFISESLGYVGIHEVNEFKG